MLTVPWWSLLWLGVGAYVFGALMGYMVWGRPTLGESE